jgi:hypothetical protein
MPSFREIRARCRIEGFHCHHIVPIELVEKPQFSILFGNLRAIGFDPQDFATNGMHLPCTEAMATIFGLPLHRGAHPQYNQMVAQQIAPLANLSVGDAYGRMRLLQKTLKQGLRRPEMVRRGDLPAMQPRLRMLEQEANALHGLLTDTLKQ